MAELSDAVANLNAHRNTPREEYEHAVFEALDVLQAVAKDLERQSGMTEFFEYHGGPVPLFTRGRAKRGIGLTYSGGYIEAAVGNTVPEELTAFTEECDELYKGVPLPERTAFFKQITRDGVLSRLAAYESPKKKKIAKSKRMKVTRS